MAVSVEQDRVVFGDRNVGELEGEAAHGECADVVRLEGLSLCPAGVAPWLSVGPGTRRPWFC